ncbi:MULTISPECIES: RNA-guided endonuclease TnpB family protein [Geobacillus]|uniref:IS200/IS605 family element transposase accessory protein TnpB n=1 Tax=Geobacillus zalihae TaxID=213419 RepID=A0A7H1RVB3_9BACL|nr:MULTISPECIES: RNA-guided endonuclease TnpB family protein [Geobacillus]EPR29241.1 Transposase [Geobacillus sp. WSUCF1]OQP13454.1 transposase [Geobacillus zalihae]OQP20248.1 transposase [Geobacillus zalihae]PJW16853.1 transposase [Geobacillus sp. WSUCF-018B]QNU18202.1 IS200/IS605 family element transposase accessory protein TnpB [Geobacillus zalihae]
MYRTVKTSFSANKETIEKLFHIRRICGVIWNDCVQLARYYYRLGNHWITQTELQKELKGKYPIHSQTIQAVAHKFLQARDSAKEARKSDKNIRFPYKMKKTFNPKWVDQAFSIEKNTLYLSLGNTKGPDGKRLPKLKIKLHHVPEGEVKEVELVYDRGLKFCLSYEDGKQASSSTGTNIAAVDQGEIHAISAVSENGSSIIITGRKMRSIHRLRNKKLAELQKLMSRCKKGSRKWKTYNRAKQYILSKSEAQLKDCLHKTTKEFVDWCLEQQIKHVVVGDVEGVQRNTKKKRNKNTNQKLSNWSFGKLYDYLKYKLEAKGITIEKVDESYTSQTCPVCGKRNKVKNRNYRCACGYEQHRDIHGASNILTKYLYGKMIPISIQPPTYLRIT